VELLIKRTCPFLNRSILFIFVNVEKLSPTR
jgi:hypothetical protein